MQYKVIGNISFRGKKNVIKQGDVFNKDLLTDVKLIDHLLKKKYIEPLSLTEKLLKKEKVETKLEASK